MSYISKSNFLKYLDYRGACLGGIQRVERLLKTRTVREVLTMYQDLYFAAYPSGRTMIPPPAPPGASSALRLKYKRVLDFWWFHSTTYNLRYLYNTPGDTAMNRYRIDCLIAHMAKHFPKRNPSW